MNTHDVQAGQTPDPLKLPRGIREVEIHYSLSYTQIRWLAQLVRSAELQGQDG